MTCTTRHLLTFLKAGSVTDGVTLFTSVLQLLRMMNICFVMGNPLAFYYSVYVQIIMYAVRIIRISTCNRSKCLCIVRYQATLL